MAKKDKSKKKGKAVVDEPTPSKKELKRREAELEAALAAKAEKPKKAKHPHVEHLDRVAELNGIVADPNAKGKARKAAAAELEELRKATLGRKKPKLDVTPIEDADERTVKVDYGTDPMPVEEQPEPFRTIQLRVAAKDKARKLVTIKPRKGETETDDSYLERLRDARDKAAADVQAEFDRQDAEAKAAEAALEPKPRKAKDDELVVEIGGETLAAPVGDREPTEEIPKAENYIDARYDSATPGAEDAYNQALAVPSDTPPVVEVNRNGYKIKSPDGSGKAYTRATTYIDNLEDKTQLTKWKMRKMLEGLTINERTAGEQAGKRDDAAETEYFLGTIRDAMHNRDVAIAKALKADRKGKLVKGELAPLLDTANKTFNTIADRIAEEAMDIGGAHDAANKGTDLHALAEKVDEFGIDWAKTEFDEERITRSDLDSMIAYVEAVKTAGIVWRHSEQVVVNDDLKVAGRLDRTAMWKAPGTQRAAHVVADIKTGKVEYGAGKIAQQIELYSGSKGYDPAKPDERVDLKLSKSKGLLIHLPQGKGTCAIYVVDLTLGHKGNAISADVRAWRNEGKRAIDFTVDLAAPVVTE